MPEESEGAQGESDVKIGTEMLRDGDLQIKLRAMGRAKGCSRRTEGCEGQTVAWAMVCSPGGRRLLLSSARFKHHILVCQTTHLFAISSLSGPSVSHIGQPWTSQQERRHRTAPRIKDTFTWGKYILPGGIPLNWPTGGHRFWFATSQSYYESACHKKNRSGGACCYTGIQWPAVGILTEVYYDSIRL